VELQYQDSLSQTQSRFSNEVSSLKEQIQEAEVARESLLKETSLLKDKVDHLRLENLTENEETVIELKRIHDHDKMLLVEDNKRLVSELDKVTCRVLTTHFSSPCSKY
jgi:serine/threonine-protein kinase MRCK